MNPGAGSAPVVSPGTDWTVRLFGRLPGPTWLIAMAAVIAVSAVSTAYRWAANDPVDLPHGPALLGRWYFWFDALNGTILVYLWVANVVLHRGMLRDLAALRPSLDLTDAAFEDHVGRIAGTPAWQLLVGGLLGSTLMGSMAFLDPGFWDDGQAPELLSVAMLFYVGRQATIGWFAGHVVANEIRATRGFAQLGATGVRIDLLDLRGLRPFALKGLRPAAACLLCSSLVSLLWLVDDTAAVTIGPIIAIVLGLSLLVFLYPLIPLHGAIVAEKERRLDELRLAIRAEQDPLHTPASAGNPRFANLVAYYALIENAREWPIEAPTVLRFAAFALLGLGSWLGGAVVERLLESFVR